MVYNLTRIADNSSNIIGFYQGVNVVLLDGWLGTLFLIGVSTVIFLSFLFSTNDASKSLTATAFIALTVGILLRAMDLMGNLQLFIVILACAATLAVSWPRN